jgi:hypothetical protein
MEVVVKSVVTFIALILFALHSYADLDFVKIDSSSSDAPMRHYPNGTNSVARVPAGTKLEVLDKNVISGATRFMPSVTWYKVQFNGKTGWVSEFVTTSAD